MAAVLPQDGRVPALQYVTSAPMASRQRFQIANGCVAFWHKADSTTVGSNVRCWGADSLGYLSPPTNWFGTAMPLVSKWPATFELNGFLFNLPERTTVCSVVKCSRRLSQDRPKQALSCLCNADQYV